jgi:NADH-quinone oxidoreductase subunit J
MSFIEYIHFFFLFILVLSSLFLILSQNPVYSVLLLILIFFCSASIAILFGIDFMGILFIIIYVGAIAVLFLFVVMMLDLKTDSVILYESYKLLAVIIIFFFFFSLIIYNFDFISIFQKKFIYSNYFYNVLDSFFNIDIFGQCLYNYFLSCFLISGIILLLAMLGAISLTLKYRSNRRNQLVYKQLSRTSNFLSYFK